jgi:hypothetical protein
MSGSVGGAGPAPCATDGVTENARDFSSCLAVEHHRRAISVERLSQDWSCTRDDVLAAVKNEKKGFVYTYKFWVSDDNLSARGLRRGLRTTHVAYQPDVDCDDINYKPLGPICATDMLGPEWTAPAVEMHRTRRRSRRRECSTIIAPTSTDKPHHRKGHLAEMALKAVTLFPATSPTPAPESEMPSSEDSRRAQLRAYGEAGRVTQSHMAAQRQQAKLVICRQSGY